MKLVIHDLQPEEWDRINPAYAGSCILSDTNTIRPCVGCFSCWDRTPGRCVIRDGYDNIGVLFHRADEVVVISRYTYGGFSGFIKNVFDRCIGYGLPQLEVVNGETHHQKRYDEDKPFTFIFYGHALSDEQKQSAERYVNAVCANIRWHIKEVAFLEGEEMPASGGNTGTVLSRKAILLNASMRAVKGNSAKLAEKLEALLTRDSEIIRLGEYLSDLPALMDRIETATDIVICTPLYLDGLPAQMIRLMEMMQREYHGTSKRVYVLSNMGLYESRQLVNLFDAVRQWCTAMGFEYSGGLAVSAGEVIGVLMQHLPFSVGFTRNVARGMNQLAAAINDCRVTEDIYTEPFCFPRWLYLLIANNSWKGAAKANGLKIEDLYRRL